MSYIGRSAAYDARLEVRSDVFSANGTQTAFALTYAVTTTTDIEVLVNNVQQSPYDGSYSVSGSTLTFTGAPSSGSNNVYVTYRDYFQVNPKINDQAILTDNYAALSVTEAKIANYAVTSQKVANTIQFNTVTLTGPSSASNTFSVNTRAQSANHATQKQYVDALTIVFGA